MSYKKHTITARSLCIALIAIGIFVLIGTNMKDLLFGAPLSVTAAEDGATLTESYLPVEGNARHAKSVLLNGRSIAIDRDGNFSDSVILSPGYNEVAVAVEDKFGNAKTKVYHLVVLENPAVAEAPHVTYQQ